MADHESQREAQARSGNNAPEGDTSDPAQGWDQNLSALGSEKQELFVSRPLGSA